MKNDQFKKDIGNIESFIKTSIEHYYSPIKIKQFIDYDMEDNAFVGLFVADNQIMYSFVIDKSDNIPMLKPYLSADN